MTLSVNRFKHTKPTIYRYITSTAHTEMSDTKTIDINSGMDKVFTPLTPGEIMSFYGFEEFDEYTSIKKQKEGLGYNDDTEIINGKGMINSEDETAQPEVYGGFSSNRVQKESLGVEDNFQIVEGGGVEVIPEPEPEPEPVVQYVDLGLPSGKLWATDVIKDANENPLYFAWGETTGYTASQVGVDRVFDWNSYRFGTQDNLTKYNNTDELIRLEPEDDAATVLKGNEWHIPSSDEYNELRYSCDIEHGNGTYRFVSKYNGNVLTINCYGYAEGTVINNEPPIFNGWLNSISDYGNEKYKSKTISNFGEDGWDTIYLNTRNRGFNILPVREGNITPCTNLTANLTQVNNVNHFFLSTYGTCLSGTNPTEIWIGTEIVSFGEINTPDNDEWEGDLKDGIDYNGATGIMIFYDYENEEYKYGSVTFVQE